jgi:hypothetical protein
MLDYYYFLPNILKALDPYNLPQNVNSIIDDDILFYISNNQILLCVSPQFNILALLCRADRSESDKDLLTANDRRDI